MTGGWQTNLCKVSGDLIVQLVNLNHVIRQLIYLAWQQTRNWGGCGPLQLISGTTTSAVSLIASSKLLFFESGVLEVVKIGPYKPMSQLKNIARIANAVLVTL